MTEALLIACLILQAVVAALLFVLLRRRPGAETPAAVDALLHAQERTERALRDEIALNRRELSDASRMQRDELAASLKSLTDTVAKQMTQIALVQQGELQKFGERLARLIETNDARLESVRQAVESRLAQLQADNTAKLEHIRATVDEKLQGTLEKRLGESFKLVSERLEQVHKGLGEMQTLASGVGDLKRVLTNVKTRGTWGEIQLGALLEQILTPDQFLRNCITKKGGTEPVEFAVRMPGHDEDGEVLLPIDAKFPQEDYLRLLDAQERADADAAEQAGADLESRIRKMAADVCAKYVDPPHTTDFAILYLPTEGLYAEILRRPGIVECLQRDCRVNIAGPTTLAALLNSLQMGFRTLAVTRRASEVWNLLGAVKSEFGKFGEVLDKVHKQLVTAGNTIEEAGRKTRTIQRKLKSVQELPAGQSQALLGADAALDEPGGEA